MLGSASLSVVISTFIASCVEMTEMVIIVVGVGAARGWRSTGVGAGSGMVILVGIVLGLGRALSLIPINVVRVIIGALLLTFGLQWYRKGVIGVAADGFTGGGGEEVDASGGSRGSGLDWTAFVLSFKGVLLEGLEIAFIVVAFGASGGTGSSSAGSGTTSGSFTSAYIGAAAAFVLIGALGFAAKSRLERVPGRTLKFGVGGLLSTFGTFWMLEGLGVHWPGSDLSLAWLYAVYLASTFALMYAVRSGALGPAPAGAAPPLGAVGPSGLAPASAASTRQFQAEHGLADDGVLGARTQAAVRAVRSERGVAPGDVPVAELGVDPADPIALRRLQSRLGLAVTGAVDAPTRGALRVLQYRGLVDPSDAAAVRRFQREHDLPESGEVDDATRTALAAVRADGADPADPVRASGELDPTDEASVCRFQRSLGLAPSGSVDAETRGALRALQTLTAADPRGPAGRSGATGPDMGDELLDADAVRAFQRRRGLAASGEVDDATRQALRWDAEHYLSVDPADPESVRAFQRDHGLDPDGIVGERTQAALRAARAEREVRDGDAAEQRYGPAEQRDAGRVVDPADAGSVRRFQQRHRLPVSGVIDRSTQTAVGAVRAERMREREQEEANR